MLCTEKPENVINIDEWIHLVNDAFWKIFLTESCDVANECVLTFNYSVSDTVH